MTAELCRTVAYEAVRRGAPSNVHELWAALERVDELQPRLIVDVGSGPSTWFAWWMMGAQVIGVSRPGEAGQPAAFNGLSLPESVVNLVGDPRDASTVLRVTDQVAGRPVDALVLADVRAEDTVRAAFNAYAPLVRPGGLVLVHGIADRRGFGVRSFWRSLGGVGCTELVGMSDPVGYGVVGVQGRVRAHV